MNFPSMDAYTRALTEDYYLSVPHVQHLCDQVFGKNTLLVHGANKFFSNVTVINEDLFEAQKLINPSLVITRVNSSNRLQTDVLRSIAEGSPELVELLRSEMKLLDSPVPIP